VMATPEQVSGTGAGGADEVELPPHPTTQNETAQTSRASLPTVFIVTSLARATDSQDTG